jgi:hypothetical protein
MRRKKSGIRRMMLRRMRDVRRETIKEKKE